MSLEWAHRRSSISQIPASGVLVTFADGLDERGDGAAAVVVQPAAALGRGEQEQRLTECVELELMVDPVAGPHRGPGVSRKRDVVLVRDPTSRHRVCRPQVRAVREYALGHELNSAVEQCVVTDDGCCSPGVALVADPGVAVVVVAPLGGALGQRGGGGRNHRTGAGREAAQDGIGMTGCSRSRGSAHVGSRFMPRAQGAVPQLLRVGQPPGELATRDLQHQVAGLASGHHQVQDESPVLQVGVLGGTGPSVGELAGVTVPVTVLAASDGHRPGAEVRPQIQPDVDVGDT